MSRSNFEKLCNEFISPSGVPNYIEISKKCVDLTDADLATLYYMVDSQESIRTFNPIIDKLLEFRNTSTAICHMDKNLDKYISNIVFIDTLEKSLAVGITTSLAVLKIFARIVVERTTFASNELAIHLLDKFAQLEYDVVYFCKYVAELNLDNPLPRPTESCETHNSLQLLEKVYLVLEKERSSERGSNLTTKLSEHFFLETLQHAIHNSSMSDSHLCIIVEFCRCAIKYQNWVNRNFVKKLYKIVCDLSPRHVNIVLSDELVMYRACIASLEVV